MRLCTLYMLQAPWHLLARRRRYNIPLDEERELALLRLQRLCRSGHSASVLDFRRVAGGPGRD